MKHRLVAVGGTGDFTVYLDITPEEALRLYKAENPDDTLFEPLTIDFWFEGKFKAYDIWPGIWPTPEPPSP